MACSRNRNNRSSNGYGCCRYAQNTRWPSSGYGYYTDSASCGCSGNCNGCRRGSDGCYAGSTSCGYGSDSAGERYTRRPPRPPFDCGPFYCGPCGSVNPGYGCCPPPPPSPCGCQIYGSFQQSGTLTLEEGGAIPFSGVSTANGVFQEDGELIVDADGIYMVTLHVTIPTEATASTLLSIRQNSSTVSGGTLNIVKNDTTAPLQAHAQVMIQANEGDRITVNSSQPLSLTADSSSAQIATLTILRIA